MKKTTKLINALKSIVHCALVTRKPQLSFEHAKLADTIKQSWVRTTTGTILNVFEYSIQPNGNVCIYLHYDQLLTRFNYASRNPGAAQDTTLSNIQLLTGSPVTLNSGIFEFGNDTVPQVFYRETNPTLDGICANRYPENSFINHLNALLTPESIFGTVDAKAEIIPHTFRGLDDGKTLVINDVIAVYLNHSREAQYIYGNQEAKYLSNSSVTMDVCLANILDGIDVGCDRNYPYRLHTAGSLFLQPFADLGIEALYVRRRSPEWLDESATSFIYGDYAVEFSNFKINTVLTK